MFDGDIEMKDDRMDKEKKRDLKYKKSTKTIQPVKDIYKDKTMIVLYIKKFISIVFIFIVLCIISKNQSDKLS